MERFPNRQTPNERTLAGVAQHLEDHGSFKAAAYDPAQVANLEKPILDSVKARPGFRQRLALPHNVSRATVWRILSLVKSLGEVQTSRMGMFEFLVSF
ncbi:hypothetical protein FQR65_LT17488 [Abscondita terminalis]|nr:hypothetical protein FQR65_LT17488 [Abscondita terminalis]